MDLVDFVSNLNFRLRLGSNKSFSLFQFLASVFTIHEL